MRDQMKGLKRPLSLLLALLMVLSVADVPRLSVYAAEELGVQQTDTQTVETAAPEAGPAIESEPGAASIETAEAAASAEYSAESSDESELYDPLEEQTETPPEEVAPADETHAEEPPVPVLPPEETADTKTPVEVHDQLVEVGPTNTSPYLRLSALEPATIRAVNEELTKSGYIEDQTPTQEKVTDGNTTIEKLTVRWLTSSTGETDPARFGTLELEAASDKVTNQQFQIDFSLSGQYSYEPGSIELVIPAYLWEDADGNPIGELTLSIPEAPDSSAEFAWTRVGDSIVITNTKTISAASKVMIQGTFRDVTAHEIKDMDRPDGKDYSYDFNATLTVDTYQGNSLTMESNTINATIDTNVEVTVASKTAYDATTKSYDIWWDEVPDSIPEELLPDDYETTDYVYVRWYVAGGVQGSQPYTMTVSDTIDPNDVENYGAVMLGISDSYEGTVKSEDGKYVEATLYEGYGETIRTAYVWTAYPREKLENLSDSLTDADGKFVLHNTQTTTVVGRDDGIETKADASADLTTRVPKTYTFIKIWDDDDDALGLRPDHLGIELYNEEYSSNIPWQTATLTEDDATRGTNYWTFTWSDEGNADWDLDTFDIKEIIDASFSGIREQWFGTELHQLGWWYELWTDTNWKDQDADTITYHNRLVDQWGQFTLSTLTKKVDDAYADATIESTQDTYLNALRRGEDVLVPYTVTTTLSVAGPLVEDGAAPNQFVLEDTRYKLNDRELTIDDIEIGRVWFYAPTAWEYTNRRVVDGEVRYDRQRLDTPKIELYGKIGEEWKLMATLDNGVKTVTNGASLISTAGTGAYVQLPANVARVKTVVVSGDAAIVDMQYRVYLRVKPTDTIKNMIEDAFEDADYIRFDLLNEANGYAIYDGVDTGTYTHGQTLVDMTANDMGYLHGRDYKVAVDLAKSFEFVNNDEAHRCVVLHTTLTLTQQSNVTALADYNAALQSGEIPNTQSGIYYDLLPYGVEPDVSTVKATNGDTIAEAYTIPNYRGSGRTMLVVKVQETNHISYVARTERSKTDSTYPSEGYKNTHTIEFDAYCPWEYYLDGKVDLRNVAAYEADEDVLGTFKNWSGEPNDPTGENYLPAQNAVGSDYDLMKNLGEGSVTRDTNSFVYAGATTDRTEIDVRAVSELRKYVKAANSGSWTTGHEGEDDYVNVQEGEDYMYLLQCPRPATDTTAKNLILLDAIEGYAPHDGDDDTGDRQWRGTLLSVDVSQMVLAGANPVVYYSTTETLADISEYNSSNPRSATAVGEKLADETKWSTTPPDDMSTVTAIAIDLRYLADGVTEYVQDDKTDLLATLYMRAPYDDEEHPYYFKNRDGEDTNGTNHLENAHAYNDIYLDGISVGSDGVSETVDNVYYGYTKVGIYARSVTVTKLWDDYDDVDGIRPEEITVHLCANGEPVEGMEQVLNEKNDWTWTFTRLKVYDEDGNRIVYTFTEEAGGNPLGIDGYTLTVERKDNGDHTEVTMTNRHEPEKISIPVTKFWADDNENVLGTRPDSVTVQLYADGVFTGKTLTIRPDANGNWYGEFTDLNKYRDHGTPIIYTIVEEPVDDYVSEVKPAVPEGDGEDAEDAEEEDDVITGYEVFNTYYPYGDLAVKKILDKATGTAEEKGEFTFSLLLETKNDDGSWTDVTQKYDYTIYDADGGEVKTGKIGNGDPFTLKGGETIVVRNIPTHVRYTVSEEEQTGTGFTLTGAVNTTGEIVSYQTAKAEFTNTYSTAGSVNLTANKRLTDRDGTSWPMTRNQFQFDLIAPDGTVYTAFSDADGNVTFGKLNFTGADDGQEYYYTVKERIPEGYAWNEDDVGYKYDETEYYVKIKPADNGDGTMTVNVTYLDADGNELDEDDIPEFRNEYYAEGEVTLRAWKTLKARDLEPGEFEFTLYDDQDTELKTVTNDGDGNVVFSGLDALKYTEQDVGKTYTYYVKEKPGGDETVVYDDETVFVYRVTVVDNGDGTLSFSQTMKAIVQCETCGGTGEVEGIDCEDCDSGYTTLTEDVTPVFRNTLEPGSFSVAKYVRGEDGDPEQQFHFKVKLVGEDVTDETVTEYELTQAPERTETDGSREPDPDAAQSAANTAASTKTASVRSGVSAAGRKALRVQTASVQTLSNSDIMPIASGNIITGATGTSGDVTWAVYTDNTLYFAPTDENATEGTLDDFTSSAVPWSTWLNQITRVEVKAGCTIHLGEKAEYLFSGFRVLTSLDLRQFDASNTKYMDYMFYNCPNLSSVNLTDFKTSSAINMSGMFMSCGSLTSLNLTGFDTSHVTNMSSMFQSCAKLTSLDVSSFDTSNVTSMTYMFGSCSSLTSLDVSNFKTNNVTDMSDMFRSCSALTELDLSSFNTGRVTNITTMFAWCSELTSINFGDGFDTSNVTDISNWMGYTPFSNSNKISRVYIGENFFKTAQNLVLPTPPTNDEYKGKWVMEDKIGDETEDDFAYTPAELRTNWNSAYVGWWVWQPAYHTYTVTFEVEDDAEPPAGFDGTPVTTKVQEAYSLPIYTRDGWILTGWENTANNDIYEVKNGVATIPADRYSHGDEITLTPIWKLANAYTISFVKQVEDAAVVNIPTQDVRVSDTFTIPTSGYVWFDHHLTKWTDNFGYEYAPGDTIPANRYQVDDNVILTAHWEQDEHNVTMTEGEFDFWLHAGEMATFKDIPAGTSYQVWEETPDGWILVEQSGVSGVIEPLETSAAEFVNTYRAGATSVNLFGSKYLDGVLADVDANGTKFQFQLVRVENGQETPIETVTASGGFFVFGTQIYDSEDYNDGDTIVYQIREVAGTNGTITYDSTVYTATVTFHKADGEFSCTVAYTDQSGNTVNDIVFNNATNPGSLQLIKVAEGAKPGTKFTFNVTFTQPNGLPLNDGVYAGDNPATVTLEVNDEGKIEPFTIENLPAGIWYHVEEDDLPAGWSLDSIIPAEGLINAAETVKVTATNTYSATGSVILNAHKLFEGNTLEAGQFTFELLSEDKETVLSTATNTALDTTMGYYEDTDQDNVDEWVENPWYGTGLVVFDKIIEFTAPGTYTYYIREVDESTENPNFKYDAELKEVTVVVTDNGDGTLSAVVTYPDMYNNANGALFRNSMQPGNLSVTKLLTNATQAALAAETEFQFRLTLKDAAGNDLNGEYTVEMPDGTQKTITVTNGVSEPISIKGGETFTVTGLPHGCTYEVTELDPDTPNGFVFAGAENDTGEIKSGKTAETTVTNAYSARGEYPFTALKNFVGGEIEDGMFAFELYDANNVLLYTAYANEEGAVTFDPVHFTEADDGKEYVYRIVEVIPDDTGHVAYDTHTAYINLKVTDNGDGTLSFDTEVLDEIGATFTNVMLYDMDISKTVEGSLGDKSKDFTFTLYLSLPDDADYALPDYISYQKGDSTGVFAPSADGWEFTLSHGETLTLLGLPYGATYRIVEEENEYNTSATVKDKNGAVLADVTVSDDGKTVEGGIKDNVSVAYVNELEGRVPTDATAKNNWPAAGTLLLSIMAALLLLLRRRRRAA